jgi:NAD(P)-dependent dehydrogenase (short-subunit alcohol dehydrogenase family)
MACGMLSSKVVLVTGAGGSIGSAVAIGLAAEGAVVLANDYGSSVEGIGEGQNAGLEATADAIRKAGGRCEIDVGSVAEGGSAAAMVAKAVRAFGRLDAAVNVAGIMGYTGTRELSEAEWRRYIDVNLTGAFLVAQAAVRQFTAQAGGGSLVHFTSNAGLVGSFSYPHYAASKAGMAGMSRTLASELQKDGIRSNCIAPFALTRMHDHMPAGSGPEARDALAKYRADAAAPLVAYLCSDAAAQVTGQVFTVMNDEIHVMSQPRPVRTAKCPGGWSAARIGESAMPMLREAFSPIEPLASIFDRTRT